MGKKSSAVSVQAEHPFLAVAAAAGAAAAKAVLRYSAGHIVPTLYITTTFFVIGGHNGAFHHLLSQRFGLAVAFLPGKVLHHSYCLHLISRLFMSQQEQQNKQVIVDMVGFHSVHEVFPMRISQFT